MTGDQGEGNNDHGAVNERIDQAQLSNRTVVTSNRFAQ